MRRIRENNTSLRECCVEGLVLALHWDARELEAYMVFLGRRPSAERLMENESNFVPSNNVDVACVPMALGVFLLSDEDPIA
jgi:hypothetical protein